MYIQNSTAYLTFSLNLCQLSTALLDTKVNNFNMWREIYSKSSASQVIHRDKKDINVGSFFLLTLRSSWSSFGIFPSMLSSSFFKALVCLNLIYKYNK